MTAKEARRFLRLVTSTETGREVLQELGLSHVIEDPDLLDDEASIAVAESVVTELDMRYQSLA